jgi:PadR family transcriptional regulator, regulatory protein AphA
VRQHQRLQLILCGRDGHESGAAQTRATRGRAHRRPGEVEWHEDGERFEHRVRGLGPVERLNLDEAEGAVHRLGWATTHTEHHGRRQRTIYEITGDGRLALHAWFATPPRTPQLDFEALLRLLFADQTDKATLDRCLEETAEGARQLFDDAIERLIRPYVTDDRAPFPERRHIAALVAAFVADYLHLIERWSEFARDEIRMAPHRRTRHDRPQP